MVHRRGGLNPPDNTPKDILVNVFGQIQSAPTAKWEPIPFYLFSYSLSLSGEKRTGSLYCSCNFSNSAFSSSTTGSYSFCP